MRTPVNCPFVPGSDAVPDIWAGRTRELADWRDVVRPRRVAGTYERGRTVLGEAGLGKSSLVRRIARDAAEHGDWVTSQLRLPQGADPLKLLASALLDLAGRAGITAAREQRMKDLLDRVEQLSVAGWSIGLRSAPGPDPHVAVTELLIEICRAAMAHDDRVVLIHLDEVQNITDDAALSQLLIALGDALSHTEQVRVPGGVVERYLPLAVYLTGLPDFEDRAGKRQGATFARRFGTTTLDPVAADDIRVALADFIDPGYLVADTTGDAAHVFLSPAAREALIACCCGEPFLFQLAGSHAWNAGTGAVITVDDVRRGWETAIREARAHVERILSRLPAREREFIDAMAELPESERTLKQITEALGMAQGAQAGPTSQRLDRVRGIIERRGRQPYTFRHRAVEAYLTSDWPHLTFDPESDPGN